jgi:hypothetical protein
MRRLVVLLVTGSVVCGCKPPASPSDVAAATIPSDEDVRAMVYDDKYRVPPGFYVDERADTPGSYTIYHVKDESLSWELCTDDYDEALALEAADNEQREVNGVFAGSYENDRYFEVTRDLAYPDGVGNAAEPTSPGYARVFKCSYVDREGVDRNLRDGYAGRLNARPADAAELRSLVEYLWQFAFFWPARAKVLDSFSEQGPGVIRHTLRLGLLTPQGDGSCDVVEVVDWVFSLDTSDGHIGRSFELRRRFEAELVDGTPRKCG